MTSLWLTRSHLSFPSLGSHLAMEMQTEHNKQVSVVGCVLFLASEITVKRKK